MQVVLAPIRLWAGLQTAAQDARGLVEHLLGGMAPDEPEHGAVTGDVNVRRLGKGTW